MTKHTKAIIALFVATSLWGSAGVIMKLSLESVGPYYFLAFRFLLAAALLAIFFIKRLPHINTKTWKIGGLMGTLLYFEFLFYTIGIQFTTVSKASFIIGASVILVPFAYLIINRKLPAKSSIVAAFVCIIGLGFVVLDDLSAINIGDLIVSISTTCYGFHLVLTARFVKDHDPIDINIVQIGIAAICALLIAPIMESFPTKITINNIFSVVYLSVAATICPYLLSVYGQKYTKTTMGAIILSFECVVGCITGVLILHDPLTPRVVLGAMIMVGSFLITEINR